MLVRRIIRNFAKQDWGVVSIELAIVVLGIFLGLQASSWYEARQEQALEVELLIRLQKDFHRHIQFDVPKCHSPRGFSNAPVKDFDVEAMRQDREFRQALDRMTAFRTFFQIRHAKTFSAADEVLSHLSTYPR